MSAPLSSRSTSSGPTSIVLAGGGSAGHTSPLIATAAELSRLEPGVRLTAVGTARGLETTVIPAAGLPLELIPPVPMPRRPGKDLALVPLRLGRAVAAAGRILARVQADAVLGFGGYVSTPVYLAARRAGIPVVIHEQNALPGMANKLAARFTRHVFTAFPDTPLPHAQCIGLPLRRAITDLDRAAHRRAARSSFDLGPELPTLLVTGGSQGAASVNGAVRGALEVLLAAGVSVVHVLGPKNVTDDITPREHDGTGARYRPVAFVSAMEDAYAAADLGLGRAGASTVLETATVGLPSVFVPYPHAGAHQARNVTAVVAAGGGLLLPDEHCTPAWVGEHVVALLGDTDRLAGMSAALSGVGVRDAAAVLAARTLEVAR